MTARLTAALLFISSVAQAAEITRVASSFEPNDPFGMFADVTFLYTGHDAKITREWYQDNASADVTELRYKMQEYRLNADVHLGIFRDLELHFGISYIFAQNRQWGFADGTDTTNSTILNNCLQANGEPLGGNAMTRCGAGQQRALFPFDPNTGASSYRSGLADLTFGIAWAPLNQKKDDASATWVLGFDYFAPVATAIDASVPTTDTSRGAVGDKVHRYKWYTAISKRIGFADPYFSLHYTLPWRASGFYSNCDNPSAERMARPENCADGANWNRDTTGTIPSHVGGFIFGSEFNMFESANKHQKIALDLRGSVTYISEGRYFNEMSDLFGKLLYTGDYFQLGVRAGLVGHAAEFIHLKVWGELAYNTEHMLTSENIGKDFSGDGQVNLPGSPMAAAPEVSPNFDYRIDRVGRRFRIEEMFVMRGFIQVSFSF
ncbi:MAG: hypothetical protein JNK82_39775 [Myxococcaceae bacterium]|nr:hypothetical protein [Myxococcaceae bacterium]